MPFFYASYLFKYMKINRLAISSFFFFVGFLYANWVARLPELQRLYDVSNATLGTLLLCWAAGAIVSMPFAGWLTVVFGSQRLTMITAWGFCLFAPMIPIFSNIWLIGGLFFFLGVTPKDQDPAKAAMNHSPLFFADESALPIGVKVMTNLALDYLFGK